jgi:hypothetical protein
MTPAADVSTRGVLLIGLGWLLVATAFGAAGAMRSLPPAATPLVLLGLTAVVLALAWRRAGFRTWLWALDERLLVALHLTRFVGACFLYLHGRGRLPYAFAVPAGWGDITVATLAAILLVAGPPRDAARRAAYIAWNALGLLDILFVVATAARLVVIDPGSMTALRGLPLSLLPTFLVPLLVATHVVLGVRLLRPDAARHGPLRR